MSLQTGGELARTTAAIIDPRTLSIPALYVEGSQVEQSPSVLHIDDIREAGSVGFIIDDSDKIMGLGGLVRLQEIIDFNFDIFACNVFDTSGNKLGKVTDFTFDPKLFTIQQIYIHQSFLRSITSTSNIINKKQIVSVSHEKIIVDSPTIHDKIADHANKATTFVNPFRTAQQADRADQNND